MAGSNTGQYGEGRRSMELPRATAIYVTIRDKLNIRHFSKEVYPVDIRWKINLSVKLNTSKITRTLR